MYGSLGSEGRESRGATYSTYLPMEKKKPNNTNPNPGLGPGPDWSSQQKTNSFQLNVSISIYRTGLTKGENNGSCFPHPCFKDFLGFAKR